MESLKGSKQRAREAAARLLDDTEVERMVAEAEEDEEEEEGTNDRRRRGQNRSRGQAPRSS